MKRSHFTAALLLAGLGSAPLLGIASAQQAPAEAPAAPEVGAEVEIELEQQQADAAWLGAQTQPLDFETADLVQVPRGTGLYVQDVADAGPAADAELRPGDVMLKLDDQVLINSEQLAVLIATKQPGQDITLTILRNGEELKKPVTLGKADADQAGFGPGGKALGQPEPEAQPAPKQARPARPDAAPIRRPIDPEQLPEHMMDIERQIHEHQQRILRLIEDIEAGRPAELDMPPMPELPDIRQMQQRHQQMIREMQRQLQEHGGQPAQPGPAQRNVVIADGEHTIRLTGDAEGWQSLKITDPQGEVLFEGDYPQDDAQWQQIPEALRDKVKRIRGDGIRLEIRPDQPKPQAKPAPPIA